MGNFKIEKCDLEGLYVIESVVFGDERGCFMETYHQKEFEKAGIHANFVQDNQSKSIKNVLRGLHFQVNQPQGKLVRVTKGKVFDVAVDIRKESKTFGQWYGVELSEKNKKQFYISEGFAHGFLVLSNEAEFMYKCTDFYNSEDECGIRWDDEKIGIIWPIEDKNKLIISKKDQEWGNLKKEFGI